MPRPSQNVPADISVDGEASLITDMRALDANELLPTSGLPDRPGSAASDSRRNRSGRSHPGPARLPARWGAQDWPSEARSFSISAYQGGAPEVL